MRMNDWFYCNLGDPILADELLDRIGSYYHETYSQAADPDECAVFVRHETSGRVHCEVCVYFSPPCAAVATRAGAVPCNRPDPSGLSLLLGSEAAWPLLFPERDNLASP